ncbi:MAG: DUF302 domain-containing protein [Coriobacteriia bacterium]|nr:DUF302 domain-containing protein [Coriobacteriia bacterium]
MELSYVQECRASYESVMEAVERAIAAHGFLILEKRDIRALLAAKGFSIAPLVIYEAVPGKRAGGMSALPDVIARCRIHVAESRGAVHVGVLRPAALCDALLVGPVEAMIRELDSEVIRIVDEAAASVDSSST